MDIAMLRHRTSVIEQLAPRLQPVQGRSRYRHQGHATDGALARVVIFDRDMLGHRADIFYGRGAWSVGSVERGGCSDALKPSTLHARTLLTLGRFLRLQHLLNGFPKLARRVQHELAGSDNSLDFVQST